MKKKTLGSRRTVKDKFKILLLSNLLKLFFRLEDFVYSYKLVNFPEAKPCIFALWHAHQCGLYCNRNKENLYALISPSNDGEIIATGCEHMGINVIRGSKGRMGVSSTIQILEKLEQGNSVAITVDGPKGPARIVKNGIINIAKNSQMPIVPMMWYSAEDTFLKFSTWDGFRIPIGKCHPVAIYGEPVYVPADADKDTIEEYRKLIEDKMQELYKDVKSNYHQYTEAVD